MLGDGTHPSLFALALAQTLTAAAQQHAPILGHTNPSAVAELVSQMPLPVLLTQHQHQHVASLLLNAGTYPTCPQSFSLDAEAQGQADEDDVTTTGSEQQAYMGQSAAPKRMRGSCRAGAARPSSGTACGMGQLPVGRSGSCSLASSSAGRSPLPENALDRSNSTTLARAPSSPLAQRPQLQGSRPHSPVAHDGAEAFQSIHQHAVQGAKRVLVAKALTKSDAHTRRLILPRVAVEANLPGAVGTPSYTFDVSDVHGNQWNFVIRSWPNGTNPKPVYVLEHISDYVKAYSIGTGDVLGLCETDQGLMVEVNTDSVINAARRATACKTKARVVTTTKSGTALVSQPAPRAPAAASAPAMRAAAIPPTLARTLSERQKVLDAMEVLASMQASKRQRLYEVAPRVRAGTRPAPAQNKWGS